MQRKCSLNLAQEALDPTRGIILSNQWREESNSMLKVSEIVQPDLVRRVRGRTVNRSSGKREKNKKWSEKETGGRILQEGMSILNGRKTRSIVDGVSV